jgi:molecular chaperone HscA
MAKISINMKEAAVKKDSQLIVGIDLGTTNSLVAIVKDGKPEAIKNRNGKSSLVPSIIHFESASMVIVGEAAKEKLVTHPEDTIFSVKRLMGKSFKDIGSSQNKLGYEILDDDTDSLVKIKVQDQYYSPIQLSAEILKELKSQIESQLNTEVSKAVITVPAYFNDSQRQATKDAGKLAGLEVLRIINEPTAASLAYGIGLSDAVSEKVAVYDLGGGTFDISILQIENGIFEVLSTHGDTSLGGDDIDQLIIDYWIEDHQISIKQLEDKTFSQSIRLLAEKAKRVLSTELEFSEAFANVNFSIKRIEFDRLMESILDKTLSSCKSAIADSGLSLSEIDKVILVGGSTRVPAIREGVKEFFGLEPFTELDPDEVVALGAAVQADILAGNNKDVLLLDITPLSLGIETVGGLMDVIITRNSKLPIKSGRNYTTSVDGQTNLKVAVFQGERDLVKDNRKLGEFILKGIPPMPAGIPKIAIHFIIDADGILKVKAMEERSNTETEIEIKSQYGLSEEEMAKMLLDSIKNAEADMTIKALIESQTEGRNVVFATNKFIKQNEWLTSAELTSIETLKGKLQTAIDAGIKNDIEAALEKLNQYSRPLAEKALDINVSKALKGKDL